MKPIATAAEMKAIDRFAIEQCGIPGVVLMENAGLKIFDLIMQLFPRLAEKRVMIFAGQGNNGGDGFVIARHLFNHKVPVNIYLVGCLLNLKDDTKTNADIAKNIGIPIYEIDEKNIESFQHDLRHAAIIIDALFGTGINRPLMGLYNKVIGSINSSKTPVVSLDIPSGIDSDTGQLTGPHIKADHTICLALLKRSHCLFPAAGEMGKVQVVDISIPQKAVDSQPIAIHLLEKTDIQNRLKERSPNSHKGTFGHVLVLAGSRGKGGAAGLAALAALRAGAGLVTLAVPESCHQALEFHPLEVMTVPLPENSNGCVTSKAKTIVLEQLQGKASLAIGPGISTDPDTISFIEALLPDIDCPTVIDADGLNCLSLSKTNLSHLPPISLLTPHPKEMARLSGKSMEEILQNRITSSQEFSSKFKVCLVLKGANTLISFPDKSVFVNPTGNAGMATGGTGDILTGILAGLLAQNLGLKNAGLIGCYLHGLTGDLLTAETGQTSLIAGDLLNGLPLAFKQVFSR